MDDFEVGITKTPSHQPALKDAFRGRFSKCFKRQSDASISDREMRLLTPASKIGYENIVHTSYAELAR